MRIKHRSFLLPMILLTGLAAGVLVFSVSADGANSRTIQISPSGQARAYAVAFSPDGQILAIGTSLGIKYFNSSDLQLIHFIPTDTWVRAVAISPDGNMLASGSYDPVVRLWQVSDGTLITELKGHTAWVRALAFSPNGKLLATASDDNTVRLWTVPEGNPEYILDKGMDGVRTLAFSPDGTILATGGFDNIIRFWQVSDGTLLRELNGSTGWIRSLAFSPDGKWLASGAFDHDVRLWRVADGTLMVTREEHSSSVLGLSFSPDGELLASASVDTTVRLWKMPTLDPYDMLRGHTDFVFSVAFSPDGRTLASGASDNTVRIWDVPVEASPVAQEHVSSPQDCKTCHHPSSETSPARVIEVGCATCHQDGALVLNWCPFFPRASGGTIIQLTYNNLLGQDAVVPQSTSDFSVVIASPGNGAHVYTPANIWSMLPINGTVFSNTVALNEIKIILKVWKGSQQIATLSTIPNADGAFSFFANIRPGEGKPYPDFLARNNCWACHQESQTVMPSGEVLLVVIATTPDGKQALDQRLIYVDYSQSVIIPLTVLDEDGQPAPNMPILSETRLYEWRERTFRTTSDSRGQASLQVEALSQNPTTYQISIPPTVINGVLYKSNDSVQVNLTPGETTTPTVTLHVQTTSGEIIGYVTGLNSPIQVWVISIPDGIAQTTTTSAQGVFAFNNLPVSQYLLATDPHALAKQGMALPAESIDLTQSPSTQVTLIAQPLKGTSLAGKVMDETGASLPFAWVSVESQIGQADPTSGVFSLFGLTAAKTTVILSAPGYYSQAKSINSQNATISSMNFNLVRRPETRIIPWGDGAITIPPETISRDEGQRIAFEQGWMWGKGEAKQPIVISWENIDITIPGGQFALERLPASFGWLYVMKGQASIQRAGTVRSVTVKAGEMVLLSQEQELHPVPYDPVIAGALHLEIEVPIIPTWQPSLSAQVRDRLARIGIGTAQAVTLITYLMEVLALLAICFMAVKWVINFKRKENKSGKR